MKRQSPWGAARACSQESVPGGNRIRGMRFGAIVCAVTLASALTASCSSSSSSGKAAGTSGHVTATVNIVYFQPSPSYLPLFVAVDGGYFAKQGITAKLDLISNTEATVSPQYQFTMAGDTEIVNAAAQGINIKILAVGVDQPVFEILGAKGITSASSLKGKKIASFPPGAVARYVTDSFLASAGISKDVNISLINQQPAAFAALKNGAVSAATLVAPFSVEAKKAGFTVLYDPVKSGLHGAMSQLDARADYIKDNPQVVQEVVTAFVQASRRVISDPSFAVKTLMKYTGVPEVSATSSYNAFKPVFENDPVKNLQSLRDIITYEKTVNPHAAGLDPSAMVEDKFVKKAIQSLSGQ